MSIKRTSQTASQHKKYLLLPIDLDALVSSVLLCSALLCTSPALSPDEVVALTQAAVREMHLNHCFIINNMLCRVTDALVHFLQTLLIVLDAGCEICAQRGVAPLAFPELNALPRKHSP